MERLSGIHHVTAVTGQARDNVRFYRDVLGLRLVKKTVNQDMVSAYHLFFADAVGSPGTDMTFFDWPQVPNNRAGVGEVSATGFIVANSDFSWWIDHLAAAGIQCGDAKDRGPTVILPFTDPEGQRLELVAYASPKDGECYSQNWVYWNQSKVPEEHALRGLAAVTLNVRDSGSTIRTLQDVLGFNASRSFGSGAGETHVFESGHLGSEIRVSADPDGQPAVTGIGGVHHVAFRTADDDTIAAWRDRVSRSGLNVTPIIDRYYFRSIYFREPGGILFEIATDGPGFTSDENLEHLGEHLALPPFLEGRRAEIEAGLTPLET